MEADISLYFRHSSQQENLIQLQKALGICAEGGTSSIWEMAVVSSPQQGINTLAWFGSARLGSVTEITFMHLLWGSHLSAGQEVKHKQQRIGQETGSHGKK